MFGERCSAAALGGTQICNLTYYCLYIVYGMACTVYFFVEAEVHPVLEQTLAGGSWGLFWTVPSGLLANLSFRLVWGRLASKRSAVKCLLMASVVTAMALNVWVEVFGWAAGELLCSMACFACAPAYYPLMPLIVTRIFGIEHTMSILAVLTTASLPASLAGPPLGAMLATVFGWHVALHAMSLASGLVIIILLFALPHDKIQS